MNELQDKKINKQRYWQDQIQKWQESKLSQADFCNQSGIKLSTFVYWRGLLLEPDKRINQFASVKIVKKQTNSNIAAKVEIKLQTGHVVYLPEEMGIKEIAKLIQLLGLPYA